MFWSKWFKRAAPAVKRIAFLDGDQPIGQVLEAYDKYLANTGVETHLVRLIGGGIPEPRALQQQTGFNKIYLRGLRTGKENTDKFIGAYIQKAVSEGYREITVVSGDYDFIDIFKMAVVLNPEVSTINFRMIILNPRGEAAKLPEQVANIEVIRHDSVKLNG